MNLLGVFLCIRSAIPPMISARGSIVCVSSLAAERDHQVSPAMPLKGGVNALVRTLAVGSAEGIASTPWRRD
jgi:NAD(P)-dependent dehydrogenase (short-subunit alcohol dehydrogenase family)